MTASSTTVAYGANVPGIQYGVGAAGEIQRNVDADASSRNRVEEALFGRMNPQIEQTRLALETRLRNQGLAPGGEAWMNSLNDIQRVMTAERALAPLALVTLGMPHETIVYENLVDDPRAHMRRATERLGVAMQDSVLAPQSNTRTVLTLSHEQVRKPINKSSIGRWKNYEFAFDDSWQALAGAHDARRTW